MNHLDREMGVLAWCVLLQPRNVKICTPTEIQQFTSGLLGPPIPSRSTSTLPSPSTKSDDTTFSLSSTPQKPSPAKTSSHRRRSSILPTSPSPKTDSVEQALHNLKLSSLAIHRRSGYTIPESRWSSSSEESAMSSKTRKSSESTRSRAASMRSKRSIKSRKSEESDRMAMEVDEVVPPVPPPVPLTPGRSRRMIDGLVKRLGLTPKKNRQG